MTGEFIDLCDADLNASMFAQCLEDENNYTDSDKFIEEGPVIEGEFSVVTEEQLLQIPTTGDNE